MREKFYIDFISDGTGKLEIDEPIGFNTISFDLMQKDKGYGRDIFFNSGESQMEFTNFRNHYLKKLLYYLHYYGFEAKAQLNIVFPSEETVIMDLDFKTAVTDDLEYLKCKCIEVSEVQIIKRRSSVKVNLFSNKDIDYAEDEEGNVISGSIIDPVSTSNILVKPKSITQKSIWEQTAHNNVYRRAQGSKTTNYDFVNPCANIIQSDIADTVSFFSVDSNESSDFYIIEAQDNLYNVKVNIEGLKLDFNTDVDNGGNGYVEVQLFVGWGNPSKHVTVGESTFNFEKYKVLLSAYKEEGQSYTYDSAVKGDFTINIDSLNRGDRINVFFRYKIRQSASVPGGRFEVWSTITGMKTTVTAQSKTYYSTTKGVRLIDAAKQVIKSISGLELNSTILDEDSLYYNTLLFNGNLLRGITDKPFYLSLDDLQNSLSTELNGDFETSGEVFFGKEDDFYTNTEIYFFDNTQFSQFEKKINERFAINDFSFAYKNFQSQKENSLDSSYDIIHGESKMTLFNKMVENKKEVSVEWIRDAFLIEFERRKAIEITDSSATQDSDNIFAIDTIVNTSDTSITETSQLYHEYNSTSENLILRSAKSPNFLALGLSVNDDFQIMAPDKNSGGYRIIKIEANSIELEPKNMGPLFRYIAAGKPSDSTNGERYTTYKYILNHVAYPLRNRTNEGITNANGINWPESFSNMRFSVRRNIENNYMPYLATCNLYWKENPIKTTFYKNNRDFTFTYDGITTQEGTDLIPIEPILSPWIYENAIFANVDLEDFINLRNNIKVFRGFVRCIDKTGNVIKLYPKKMSYENLSKELNILGEAKYEPQKMNITTENENFIVINGEVSVVKLIWEIVDHELFIYDSNRQRLFNGVFWDNVAINGAFAKSEEELTELLNLL